MYIAVLVQYYLVSCSADQSSSGQRTAAAPESSLGFIAGTAANLSLSDNLELKTIFTLF